MNPRYNRTAPPIGRIVYGRLQPLIIQALRTKNNVVFTISFLTGKILYQATAGAIGIQGSRRDSPTSAEIAARKVMRIAEKNGYTFLIVRFIGPFDRTLKGVSRAIQGTGIPVARFHYRRPTPHNGVRLKKPRRV